MNLDVLIFSEALTAEERRKIPRSKFGIPESRKFPLIDKGHTMSAMSYFHSFKGDKETTDELARRIAKAAKKYKIKIHTDSTLFKYLDAMENEVKLSEASGMGGLNYYAEFPEKLTPRHIPGMDVSCTPNQLLDMKNNMTDEEKMKIDEFYTIIDGSKYPHIDRTNFIRFIEQYTHMMSATSESLREEFVSSWTRLVQLAESNNNTVALKMLGRVPNQHLNEGLGKVIYNSMYNFLGNAFEHLDLSESTVMEDLEDIYDENMMEPVYVLLTKGTTLGNKVVSAVTHTPYGHASISFDHTLEKLYSFGTNRLNSNPNKRFMTFIEEDLATFNKVNAGKVEYGLYAIFISKDKKEKMKKAVSEMVKSQTKFNFNYLGIFGYLLNTPVKVKDSFFCSEFIATVFKNVGIELFEKPSQLVAPHDFAYSKKFIRLDGGDTLTKYKPKTIEKKIKMLLNKLFKPIGETKLFKYNERITDLLLLERFNLTRNTLPFEIDEDGNITIHKIGAVDYPSIYAESHRLLQSYLDTGNYAGIKYELAKLWVCNKGIEKKLHAVVKDKNKAITSIERKKLIDTRAMIINDFKKYLKLVMVNQPDFNFEQYYKETEFNDDKFRISKYTLQGIVSFVKQILL
ncbi:MAG: hypothetical protein ACRCXX_05800 [Cetobacterium sp.]|uniref:hypothetical protein n=1 Tax=Cetobacterium sp. TaxID=2071632 RepID=UPI003F2AA0D8